MPGLSATEVAKGMPRLAKSDRGYGKSVNRAPRPTVAEVARLKNEIATSNEQRDAWRKTAKEAQTDLRLERQGNKIDAANFAAYLEKHAAHNAVVLVMGAIILVLFVMWLFK